MSDVIRAYGMKMSHNGTCRKCGEPTNKSSHEKCYRWPVQYGIGKGFHYVANTRETTVQELMDIVKLIVAGESVDQPIRFDLRIMAVSDTPPVAKVDATKEGE